MGKSMYDLREMLCEELENLTAQRTNLTGEKLKAIDMLTHSIKSIDTIIAMEDAEYSNARGGRGGSNDSYGRGSYARDSYARRGGSNDSYGRGGSNDSYARRGGNSRGYSRDEDLRQQLEEMMQESSNKDREVIKRFMEQMGM